MRIQCSTMIAVRSHTVAKVKNPADVALAFRRIGASTIEPVPAGSTEVNLRLSAIDVEQPGFMVREGGVLRIECNTCTDGKLTLLNGEHLTAQIDTSVEAILSESRGNRRLDLPLQYTVSGALDIHPLLRTPSANIEYFEQTTEPVRELGWLLIPGGVLAIVGLIVIPQDAVIGMSMFTPGLALSAFGGWHLVISGETERFNAGGQSIPMRPAQAATTRPAATAAAEGSGNESSTEGDAAEDEGGIEDE